MVKDFIKKIVKEVDDAELGVEEEVKYWVDTGNYALNEAISGNYLKGLPLGRVAEIFGDPSTGKSMLIYHLLANIQKMGGTAILDDTEYAYSQEFGKKIGVNNEELIRLKSLTVEEHFEKIFVGWKSYKNKDGEITKVGKSKPSIIQMILEEEKKELIGVALDSLALLSTRHEQEVLFEKPDMIKAKMIKSAFRMSSDIMKKGNVLHVISNHVISNIGVLYGPKKTTPGGSGVPFQASVRIDLSLGKKITSESKIELQDTNDENVKEKGDVIGVQTRACVVKNKMSSPFRKSTINIYYDGGMDRYSGLYDSLLTKKIISEDGSRSFKYIPANLMFKKSEFQNFLDKHFQDILGMTT